MSLGKVAVLAVALIFVSGGVGAALADWNSPAPGPAIDLVDVDARKDEPNDDGLLASEEDDDDLGGGGGAPGGAAQVGDGDNTAGNDGTAGGDNTQAAPAPAPAPIVLGDGDATAGNDQTAGGDNTEDAAAGAAGAAGAGQAPISERQRRCGRRRSRCAVRRRFGGRHGLSRVPHEPAPRLPDPRPQPGVCRPARLEFARGGLVAPSYPR